MKNRSLFQHPTVSSRPSVRASGGIFFRKIEVMLLSLIIVLALVLRLYKIDNPIADWHSFRQADTASVTREYLKHGINWLVPKYHDLSNIQSGKENPAGYRMAEFPLVNGITATIIQTLHLQAQEVLVGRLTSVFFSLITIVSIFFLGRSLGGPLTGLAGAIVFGISPYSVYYSRTILPEPALLAFSTLSLALFSIWLEKKDRFLYPSALLSLTLALLVKPYAIFLTPLFLVLCFVKKAKIKDYFLALFMIGISAIPLALWRNWILRFPEGIPASDWLYNKDNIRFKGAFFHWLFEIRLGILILGVTGSLPLVLGIFKKDKFRPFYVIWAICLFAYLSIFAGGNIQHDYYQFFLMPFIALAIGRGISFLWELPQNYLGRKTIIFMIGGITVYSLFVSWYNIRGYYQINNWPIVEAGQKADQVLPKDAKVIAPYNGDTAFLFQTNRTGWPIGYYIDQKIKEDATAYVTVVYDDEAHTLEKQYPTLAKTDNYLIIDLTHQK